MMTRKDYITTAAILSEYKNEIEENIFQDLVFNFSKMFADDNSRFDVERFKNACSKEK